MYIRKNLIFIFLAKSLHQCFKINYLRCDDTRSDLVQKLLCKSEEGQIDTGELPLDLLQSYCVGTFVDPEDDVAPVSSV